MLVGIVDEAPAQVLEVEMGLDGSLEVEQPAALETTVPNSITRPLVKLLTPYGDRLRAIAAHRAVDQRGSLTIGDGSANTKQVLQRVPKPRADQALGGWKHHLEWRPNARRGTFRDRKLSRWKWEPISP